MRAHTHHTAETALPAFLISFFFLVSLIIPLPSALAQDPAAKLLRPQANEIERSNTAAPADAMEDERRAFAISLVISLADETRNYSDLALRPRVLARRADTLWKVDNTTARALLRRAWEAAEQGDAQDLTVKTKDNPPPLVVGLRRLSGRDLRAEVLSLVARRDRTLAEEFFTKLKKETEREIEDSKSGRQSRDGWSTSEAVTKRLLVAGKLLDDGQVEAA